MRLTSLILAISLPLLTGFTSGHLGRVDIKYDFESKDIASGPDSFELFEATTSEVSISSKYAFRGSRSLHIQDYQENQSFPEFQGYFPRVSGGTLKIGFALMTPNPEEPFNIAFAGPEHFRMTQNGLGFWLINDAGTLRHMSDSIPKRLLTLEPFQWYWFEIELDITNGIYSIVVRNEANQELSKLSKQLHPSNAKRSSLEKYSFIGDLGDQGNANFYIDEVILSTEYADSPEPLIAPGRRALFLDQWDAYHKQLENLNHCLPPKLPYDFIDIYNTQGVATLQANTEALRSLLYSPTLKALSNFEHKDVLISGIAKWAEGCAHLKSGDLDQAIKALQNAQSLIGNSPAPQMALALAYSKAEQAYAAQALISTSQAQWPDDVRWPVLSAALGFMSGRLHDSEAALRIVAKSIELDSEKALRTMQNLDWLTMPAAGIIRSELVWNEETEGFLVAEQYYFSLLWQNKYIEAEDYAEDIVTLLKGFNLKSALWYERVGDAALFARRLSKAEGEYKKALSAQNLRLSSLQKLADVYFLKERPEDERKIRESIYGALNYED